MSEIKLTITVPGLPEAINNLADAIKFYVDTMQGPVCKAVDKATRGQGVQSASSEPVQAAPSEAVAQNVTPQQPVAPQQPNVPTQAPMPVPQAPVTGNYTIEQLSIAGAALCEQGKMAQLIGLLGKYGVQAVTQLKPTPDVLNPFAAELKALGAKL